MKKKFSIAIDGPSASGKSTIAKILADRFNFLYVDTGAMYRAYTYACLIRDIDPKNEEKSCAIINDVDINFNEEDLITLNGNEIHKEIRSNIVADNVSYIASYQAVREALVKSQREIAKGRCVVMDGRDIGTNVLPNAEIKIFMIAEASERAKRRYEENIANGIESNYEEVLANVKKRDYIDSHREHSPLTRADDAITIDTTYLSIEEVVEEVIKIIKDKGYLENE